jgi:membrane protein insertase Oxa1/YidC/SpoIIIJ
MYNVFWFALFGIFHIAQWIYEVLKDNFFYVVIGFLYVVVGLTFFFLMDALITIRNGLDRELGKIESILEEIRDKVGSNLMYMKLEDMESTLKEIQDKVR